MNKFDLMTYTKELISNISEMEFIYEGKKYNLINELKNIPRAGKHLRFDEYGIFLPKRSIYDHMNSLALSAKIFLDELNLDLDRKKIAEFIVFHDLAESIMGDTPFFTSPEIAKLIYKTKDEKEKEELKLNAFFIEKFPDSLKQNFIMYEKEFFGNTKSKEKKFFDFIDRFDPILNIWIYIYKFKNEIDINYFLTSLTDFFDNPKVREYATQNDFYEMTLFFQNKDNAKEFYNSGLQFLENKKFYKINGKTVGTIIQRDNIHYV